MNKCRFLSVFIVLILMINNKIYSQRSAYEFTLNDKKYMYEYILNHILFYEDSFFDVTSIVNLQVNKNSSFVSINTNPHILWATNLNYLKKMLGIDSLAEISNSFNDTILQNLNTQIQFKLNNITSKEAELLLKQNKSCIAVVWFSNIYYSNNLYYVFISQLKNHKDCFSCINTTAIFEFEVCQNNKLINFRKRYDELASFFNNNKMTIMPMEVIDLSVFKCN